VKVQDVVPSIQQQEADGCDGVSSCQEDRVDTRKNAPLTAAGRLRMVQAVLGGETISAVAQRWQTDRKSVRKWVIRYRAEGKAGLRDRSSRLHIAADLHAQVSVVAGSMIEERRGAALRSSANNLCGTHPRATS